MIMKMMLTCVLSMNGAVCSAVEMTSDSVALMVLGVAPRNHMCCVVSSAYALICWSGQCKWDGCNLVTSYIQFPIPNSPGTPQSGIRGGGEEGNGLG